MDRGARKLRIQVDPESLLKLYAEHKTSTGSSPSLHHYIFCKYIITLNIGILCKETI
jgi:hypothetical protein